MLPWQTHWGYYQTEKNQFNPDGEATYAELAVSILVC